jgi:hypothetical protein
MSNTFIIIILGVFMMLSLALYGTDNIIVGSFWFVTLMILFYWAFFTI